MKCRVEIPAHVENLIFDQTVFIAPDAVDRALKWADETRNRIKALGHSPLANPMDDHVSQRVGHEIRRLTIGKYLIYCCIDHKKKVVVIEGYRHGARLPESP